MGSRTPAATVALSVGIPSTRPCRLATAFLLLVGKDVRRAGIALDDEHYCRLDVWREAAINYRTSRRIVDAADGSAFEGFLAGRRRRSTHRDRQHGCQTQSDNHKQKAQRYGKPSPAAG
jgi:hypothetical protein